MIYQDVDKQWRWRRISENKVDIIADSSEGYKNQTWAVRMAKEVNGGDYTLVDEYNNPFDE